MALKQKPKSFELDILSEAESAQERSKDAVPRVETERGGYLSPMGKEMHAGVDVKALPAMTDLECVMFYSMRKKGSYTLVFKRGEKYYLGLGRTPLDTKMVKGMIKKGWLAKSARLSGDAYFVTAHMVYGWRKRMGI